MRLTETNKKVARLKNFESTLLKLRNTIRGVKHDYRRNVKETTCVKTQKAYNEKLKLYAIKEFNVLVKMLEGFEEKISD
ncbi:hypothetical protein [Jejuia spongiicola]|uniref:Uncharacterized protein n=1 Tax=Jejuia spongiicola TaxID=2942207 RepID=A0ABT0QI31_9FLAO|nr:MULTISPECIES: hypothetical protein [Flavobacteriaceae]MCL6296656.1 hypothetical protein [Jejuia spongiicola]PIA80684.1 hypothetical protein BFR04_15860 [Gaetbulibacter sp. 4G1]